ncbi:MAG: POTRA domain-containing protein [Bdellovibrionia bacterium]
MRNIHLALLALVICNANAALASNQWDLKQVPESQRESVEKVLSRTDLPVPILAEEIINTLHKNKNVRRVKIVETTKNNYTVEVLRNQLIKNLEITGNKSLSTTLIEELFLVKEGDIFNLESVAKAAERVRLYYQDQGFFNATIDVEYPTAEDGQINLNVKISENTRTRLKSIRIQSANPDLNRNLERALKRFVGKSFSNEMLMDLQSYAKEWLADGTYFRSDLSNQEIQLENGDKDAILNFTIERTESYEIKFKGHQYFSTGKLKSIVGYDEFYTANPSVGSEMAAKIKEAYLKKGYARVEVTTIEETGKDPYSKTVTITINEGFRIKIADFSISGRISRNSSYYSDFILENSSELIRDGYYSREDLDIGFENLILQLQNEGFLMAKIISHRVQYSKERNSITVYLNLDEGSQTFVESIIFSGNNSFKASDLRSLTNLREKEPLRLKDIETSINAIKGHYNSQGYIEMQLLNEGSDLVLYNSDNTRAAVQFKIQEGPQVRVASIAIEGNDFTKDYVILREIEIAEGDLLTPEKVEESTSRLQRSGYFNTVEIKTLEERTSVTNRTLIVKVSEREPGVFTLGAGATNEREFTLRGYLGVAYRNLWGTGRGISLRLEGNYNVADVKYLESKVTVGYLEPYLFNTRVRGRLNITRSSLVTNYDIGQISEVRQTTWSVEKEFNKHVLGIYEVYSLATVSDFGLDSRYTFEPTTLDIATTGPTLDIDYRDNPFNPTEGTFTRLKAEYSTPEIGSSDEIEYWKATGSFTHYWKLSDKPFSLGGEENSPLVWANNFQTGFLQNLSLLGGVPYDKKGFILGGRTTVRGFEAGTREVFPNVDDLGTDKYVLTTDATMFLIKSELRFPIYGAFGGALFYDGGSVTISGLKFKDTYRESAGFGFRYNTPVGPLNLEFAWKLDQKENEDPWKFHLSIGTF